MELEVNQTFTGIKGEAMRVVDIKDGVVLFGLFESEFAGKGPVENFSKLAINKIDMLDYKKRCVAMKIFQSEKKHGSAYEDHLMFYEQIKDKPDSLIEDMFINYGGFHDYRKLD